MHLFPIVVHGIYHIGKMAKTIAYFTLCVLYTAVYCAVTTTRQYEYDEISPDEDPTTIAGLFEGDIANVKPEEVNGPEFRNLVMPHNVWTNNEIPIYVSNRLFSEWEREAIQEAVDEIESLSCVRFIPYNGHSDYVYFVKEEGCFSDVGFSRGPQKLSLGLDACFRKGVIMHELLHSAGFWHEQSREDRDNYISIDWSNIDPVSKHNFKKYTWSTTRHLGESYDYGSLMHYGSYAFAIDRSIKTIETKIPDESAKKLGQRRALSEVDIRKLNKLYECDEVKKYM